MNLTNSPMTRKINSDHVLILEEPALEFLHGQQLQDPHDGLALFGPYDSASSIHPKSIPYGVVGTEQGIGSLSKWSSCIRNPILLEESRDHVGPRPLNEKLWPPFPGFEAAFLSSWPETPVWTKTLNSAELRIASNDLDPYKRAFGVVNSYLNAIYTALRKDGRPTVVICVVPEDVWRNCRPKSRLVEGVGARLDHGELIARRAGQTDLVDPYDPQQYLLSVDFRRQIKARVMESGTPIQIIRETTLRLGPPTQENRRNLTPLPDRAWNLSTALYYKAGAKPWRLSGARDGVCYIGVAFRQPDQSGAPACCAAQMFLDSGDGVVFMGEDAPMYSEKERQFHLSEDAAHRLLSGVLKTYAEQGGKKLVEIFLHYRSEINAAEFAGFSAACPPGVKLVGIRVRLERFGLRLYRRGSWPVIRGTFLKVNERKAYLWGSGFKPRWGTYDGWEVPVPLRIDIQHGQGDIERVAMDIFGLTKLNYNACRLGNAEPVTIGYSDMVGEILVANPTVRGKRPNFKYYI
jgi:hypothetical protein